MEMKIYSLGLFALMLICFWGLFSLNKEQGKFYKILLCSVGLVYLLLFIDDFSRIFLDLKYSLVVQRSSQEGPFFALCAFLLLPQFFLLFKFYPHRWIHSTLYWTVFARLARYPYGPDFGEKNLVPFVMGGLALIFYLWITLFFYRKNIVYKILFFFSSLWFLHILIRWILPTLIPTLPAFAEALPLNAFVRDFFIYLDQFLNLSEIFLAFLGATIFYVIFYAGEFVLCLAVWGAIQEKNRNQAQEANQPKEISQAKETNQLKEA